MICLNDQDQATDGAGFYQFVGLGAGDYRVHFEAPSCFVIVAGANGAGWTSVIELDPAEERDDVHPSLPSDDDEADNEVEELAETGSRRSREGQMNHRKLTICACILCLAGYPPLRGDDLQTSARAILRLGSTNLTHRESVQEIQLFPDGATLASWGFDRRIVLWDVPSGEARASLTLERGSTIASLSISPKGDSLAAVINSQLFLLDSKQLRKSQRLNTRSCETALFAPAGDAVALIDRGNNGNMRIRVLDLATFKERYIDEPDHGNYYSLAFSPDGKRIAAARDHSLVIAELSNRQNVTIGPFDAPIIDFDFSSDGKRIVVTTMDATVSLWTSDGRQNLITRKVPLLVSDDMSTTLPVRFVGESLVITGDRDGMIRFWDDSLNELGNVRAHIGVTSLAVASDKSLLYSGGVDHLIKCWDLKTKTEKMIAGRFAGLLMKFAVSPEHKTLATGVGSLVSFWDLETGKKRHDVVEFEFSVLHTAFSADGRLFAASAGFNPLRVPHPLLIVWNQQTNNEVFSYSNPNRPGVVPAFHLSNRKLVFCEVLEVQPTVFAHFVQAWDLDKNKRLWKEPAGFVSHVDVSPDGNWIAGASLPNSIYLFEAAAGKMVERFEAHTRNISALFFHPRQDLLISASEDCSVRVWKLENKRLKETFALQQGEPITAAAISPRGDLLAVGCENGEIHLWHFQAKKRLGYFRAQEGSVQQIQFVDERRLLSRGGENTCVLWRIAVRKKD